MEEAAASEEIRATGADRRFSFHCSGCECRISTWCRLGADLVPRLGMANQQSETSVVLNRVAGRDLSGEVIRWTECPLETAFRMNALPRMNAVLTFYQKSVLLSG